MIPCQAERSQASREHIRVLSVQEKITHCCPPAHRDGFDPPRDQNDAAKQLSEAVKELDSELDNSGLVILMAKLASPLRRSSGLWVSRMPRAYQDAAELLRHAARH